MCNFFCICLVRDLLSFLVLWMDVFQQFWKITGNSLILSLPSSDAPITCVILFCSKGLGCWSSFLLNLLCLSVLYVRSHLWTCLQVQWAFPWCTQTVLKPIKQYHIFISSIFTSFFFFSFTFLLEFSTCSYMLTFPTRSFNTFFILILKSYCTNSTLEPNSDLLLLTNFSLDHESHFLMFFICSSLLIIYQPFCVKYSRWSNDLQQRAHHFSHPPLVSWLEWNYSAVEVSLATAWKISLGIVGSWELHPSGHMEEFSVLPEKKTEREWWPKLGCQQWRRQQSNFRGEQVWGEMIAHCEWKAVLPQDRTLCRGEGWKDWGRMTTGFTSGLCLFRTEHIHGRHITLFSVSPNTNDGILYMHQKMPTG